MALVKGTNYGLVATIPTANPEGPNASGQDNNATALKIITTDAITITEIGWYCSNDTEEANFEVGIFNHNSVSDIPGNLLAGASQTNAKGTKEGWKVGTVNIKLLASTTYWISVALTNTITGTNIDADSNSSGDRRSTDLSTGTFNDPFEADSTINDRNYGIYALWEIEPPSPPPPIEKITFSNIVSQSWQNIYDLINTRTNVVDPLDSLGNRKMVYSREPSQKGRDFTSYPYVIVHPVTADFVNRSLDSNKANVEWEIELEVHSSDNMLHKDHSGKGNAYANQLSDDVIQTLNDSTNRITLRGFGMSTIQPNLVSTDVVNIKGDIIFVRRFVIPFKKRLSLSG